MIIFFYRILFLISFLLPQCKLKSERIIIYDKGLHAGTTASLSYTQSCYLYRFKPSHLLQRVGSLNYIIYHA